MKKTFILLTFCMLCVKSLFGAPSYPYPITFMQPNGDTLTLVMQGDEFLKFATTEDGYTLMYNSNGFFCYAQQNAEGEMEPSGYIAKSITARSAEERFFLQTTPRGLFYSKSQLEILSQIRQMRTKERDQQRAFPTIGARKLICILIGFTDKPFVRTQAEFSNLFNQIDYSFQDANGSIKDFFLEVSYSQLDLSVDVAGPYTASKTHAYYGANDTYSSDVNARELIQEACLLADPDVNYALYDNDQDGNLDGIYIIYAGYDEAAGGGANCIWAHAWYLENPLFLDGVQIKNYSCSSELRGTTGSNITNIGLICHEFGHVLGAPDYYDSNGYGGGYYDGTGKWDLMSNGCWNDDGRTPPHPNPRAKVYHYNWATVTELSSPQLVSISPSIDNKTAFYKVSTTTANEYFMIENRQKKKFDTYLPGHGLLIYRTHSQIGSFGINDTHPQQFYPVAANAFTPLPTSTTGTYGTINGDSCPWPGSEFKTEFTDSTTPSMKSWGNANTNKPITNITEDSSTGIVTFSFMSGSEYLIRATAGGGGTISPAGNINVPPGGSKSFNFTPNGGNIIYDVIIDQVSHPEAVAAASYTFTDVQTNHTIHVTFGCPARDLPITENFNNTIFPPTCWENSSTANTFWKRAVTGSNPPCSPYSGMAMLHFDSRTYPSGATGLFVTPQLITDNQPCVLNFWIYRDNTGQYTGKLDKVNIYLTETSSITGLTPVYTVFRNRLIAPVENFDGWYPYTVVLSTELMNTAYLIFEGVSDNGNNIYMEDISIELYDPAAVCNAPTNLTVNYNTDCKAELSWEAPTGMLETSLKGYNIYRDGIKVASEITQTTFTDAGFDVFAIQTWEVKTVCLNGESDPVSATMSACDTVLTISNIVNPTGFTLYPNPVNNLLKVVRTTTGKAQLEIYASDGALVMTQVLDIHDEILNINVTSLSAGIYMVRLTNGSGASTQRFIKQ